MTKKHKPKPLIADTGDSACFDDLRYSASDGGVYATFARDGSQYFYELSRADAKDWFADDLGRWFNENLR
jgi:hypothetical protein